MKVSRIYFALSLFILCVFAIFVMLVMRNPSVASDIRNVITLVVGLSYILTVVGLLWISMKEE